MNDITILPLLKIKYKSPVNAISLQLAPGIYAASTFD